ncbi:MAG: RNA polymerase sigma factor [Fibrobacteres bacterium]|nr:RNA polymerase sigma factor [Fibrobacterota bacterium]
MINFSDSELMSLFGRNDDHEAYRELVNRYSDRFIRFAWLILGNRDDSEDAAQDTFIRIVKQRSSYKSDTAFSSWAFTILRNICFDQLRKRKTRNAVPVDDSLTCNEISSDCAEKGEDESIVREILSELSDEERKIVSLRIYAEHEFAEIALLCGITMENAKKRYYRTLEKLKKRVPHCP